MNPLRNIWGLALSGSKKCKYHASIESNSDESIKNRIWTGGVRLYKTHKRKSITKT